MSEFKTYAPYGGGQDPTIYSDSDDELEDQISNLEDQLTELEHSRPLCADHSDKQKGKPCLACTIEVRDKRIAELEALARKYQYVATSYDGHSNFVTCIGCGVGRLVRIGRDDKPECTKDCEYNILGVSDGD